MNPSLKWTSKTVCLAMEGTAPRKRSAHLKFKISTHFPVYFGIVKEENNQEITDHKIENLLAQYEI